MAEVSRNLVAILLILVIVVSGFGTWALLGSHRETTSTPLPSVNAGSESGLVGLSIQKATEDKGVIALNVAPGANHG